LMVSTILSRSINASSSLTVSSSRRQWWEHAARHNGTRGARGAAALGVDGAGRSDARG
jgi:hypothetical protein